jgi:hypothetical protein
MLTHFIPTGRNRWDLKVDGAKKGRIEKQRGSFVAILTRDVSNAGKDGICFFLAELNGLAT